MLRFTRTANAGGLLELDGTSILLDGASLAMGGYLPTPPEVLEKLCHTHIDLIAFTHDHSDHFSPDFIREYEKRDRVPILTGTHGIAQSLPEYPVVSAETLHVGAVQVTKVPSRHMGAGCRDVDHCSYMITGSACVWFLGDAAPLQWMKRKLPFEPDVLIVPFAYVTTEPAWKAVEYFAPRALLLVHLPDPEQDCQQLWKSTTRMLAQHPEQEAAILQMNECAVIDENGLIRRDAGADITRPHGTSSVKNGRILSAPAGRRHLFGRLL